MNLCMCLGEQSRLPSYSVSPHEAAETALRRLRDLTALTAGVGVIPAGNEVANIRKDLGLALDRGEAGD
jgi:hypothetical protein